MKSTLWLRCPQLWVCSWGEITCEEMLPDASWVCDQEKGLQTLQQHSKQWAGKRQLLCDPVWLLGLLIKTSDYTASLIYSYSVPYTAANTLFVLHHFWGQLAWAFTSCPHSCFVPSSPNSIFSSEPFLILWIMREEKASTSTAKEIIWRKSRGWVFSQSGSLQKPL